MDRPDFRGGGPAAENPSTKGSVVRRSPDIPAGSTRPSSHLSHGAGRDWDGRSGGDGPSFPGPREQSVSVGGQPPRHPSLKRK
jgi:hypothetical protein